MTVATAGRVVLDEAYHNELIAQVYVSRGYDPLESATAARWCGLATRHGIKTHAALKALHLEHVFGKERGLSQPRAEITVCPSRFAGVCAIKANRKLGQAVAEFAMTRACELADQFGVGIAVVDDAFHYLWGGGYVMEAARRGYIAYTNCTSALAEVVPFKGRHPTLGTNPHSWGFPTVGLVGFPIVIDWATSGVAMGNVQALLREGKSLPPDVAVDAQGQMTTDPAAVAALLPMGGKSAGHKGYALGLLIEIYGAMIGGSLPTTRGLGLDVPAKRTSAFFFQAIHPDAMATAGFATAAERDANLKAVLDDILGHGNRESGAILPGELEARASQETDRVGGLIFSSAELAELRQVVAHAGLTLDDKHVRPLA